MSLQKSRRQHSPEINETARQKFIPIQLASLSHILINQMLLDDRAGNDARR